MAGDYRCMGHRIAGAGGVPLVAGVILMGWQPIATAPVHEFDPDNWWSQGTSVLIFAGTYARIASYSYTKKGKGRWRDHYGTVVAPTHWMPLPAPPEQEQSND
jgi:hypothetical protein